MGCVSDRFWWVRAWQYPWSTLHPKSATAPSPPSSLLHIWSILSHVLFTKREQKKSFAFDSYFASGTISSNMEVRLSCLDLQGPQKWRCFFICKVLLSQTMSLYFCVLCLKKLLQEQDKGWGFLCVNLRWQQQTQVWRRKKKSIPTHPNCRRTCPTISLFFTNLFPAFICICKTAVSQSGFIA